MYYYQTITILGRTISIQISNQSVWLFKILAVPKPDKQTTGISSRCYGGSHVTFLDFDGLEEEEIEQELLNIIKRFKLSDFLIFKNDMPKSYHAICLDKFDLYEALNIIAKTSADRGFINAPWLFKQRRWVLRVLPKGKRKKPEFLGIIQSRYDKHEVSTPHKEFLQIHYNIKLKKYKNEDGINDFVETTEYNTGSKVK